MAFARTNGARLAYVVMPIDGTVMRERVTFEEVPTGRDRHGHPRVSYRMKRVEKEEPGGFMVYFPRGHAIRIRTKDELEHFNLHPGKAEIVNLQGLNNPKSPLGMLLAAQDNAGRMNAMKSLEMAVIQLATAKSGVVLMPEQVEQRNGGKKQKAA